MRIATLFTGVAAAALAVAAPAQDPDQAGTEAPPEFGLSGLSGTVNQLSDSPPEEAAPEEAAQEENAGPEAAQETDEAGAQAPQAEAETAAVPASGEPEVQAAEASQAAPTAAAPSSPPPPVDAEQRAEMQLGGSGPAAFRHRPCRNARHPRHAEPGRRSGGRRHYRLGGGA